MGRHALPDDDRKTETIGVSVTRKDHKRYHAAAKDLGVKLSELIRLAIEAYLSDRPRVRIKK